ncbi:MAG: glycosyltransferase [Terracidiphilus sp.]
MLLTLAGIGYFAFALLAAGRFLAERRAPHVAFAPRVSVLKSLKGLDPGMMDALRSHCRQSYAGEFELLFGVSSLSDPAAGAVGQLKAEFPSLAIQLIECPQRLGANGKVSTLIQLAAHARHDFLLINDSDITVGPHYLERVIAGFAPGRSSSGAEESKKMAAEAAQGQSSCVDQCGHHVVEKLSGREVGLVTALYRGRAHGTLPSRLEELGIATDFQAAVLLSKWIEGGLHYGLGSTLAVRRATLARMGGLEGLLDHLADDYELGARVVAAGYRVALSAEVVETSIPAYSWRGFLDHQLRWERTVRDVRPWGYAGLIFTHGLAWALINVVLCAASPLSLNLLGVSFLLRMALAVVVGWGVLADPQVLPGLWLVPLRDLVAMAVWAAGFAGSTIVWRGERFALKNGKLSRIE